MRILEQARMHRLRHRAASGHAHLRAILDPVRAMRRCSATPLGHEHREQLPAVGGPREARDERRQQRRAAHLRRAPARDVGHVRVRRVGEVRDVRDLRARRRELLCADRRPCRRLQGARLTGARIHDHEAGARARRERSRAIRALVDLQSADVTMRQAEGRDRRAFPAGGAQEPAAVRVRRVERDVGARREHDALDRSWWPHVLFRLEDRLRVPLSAGLREGAGRGDEVRGRAEENGERGTDRQRHQVNSGGGARHDAPRVLDSPTTRPGRRMLAPRPRRSTPAAISGRSSGTTGPVPRSPAGRGAPRSRSSPRG